MLLFGVWPWSSSWCGAARLLGTREPTAFLKERKAISGSL
jgi:hypothetical protein